MPEAPTLRLLVWRAGGMRCAAPIDRLREVLPRLEVTRLPGTPPTVRGLANVRGELLTVVDGRTVMGLPDDTSPEATVLIRVGRRTVAFAVDDVEDLVTVREDLLRPLGPGGREGWEARVDDAEPARLVDLDLLLGPLFPD
jgi:chemotaxis signal transduction protein